MPLPFCAYALEWWLKEMGKFQGAKVSTREVTHWEKGKEVFTNTYQITEWEVDGVPQPSDSEVLDIIEAYAEFELNDEKRRESERKVLLEKLGIKSEEVARLKELL